MRGNKRLFCYNTCMFSIIIIVTTGGYTYVRGISLNVYEGRGTLPVHQNPSYKSNALRFYCSENPENVAGNCKP